MCIPFQIITSAGQGRVQGLPMHDAINQWQQPDKRIMWKNLCIDSRSSLLRHTGTSAFHKSWPVKEAGHKKVSSSLFMNYYETCQCGVMRCVMLALCKSVQGTERVLNYSIDFCMQQLTQQCRNPAKCHAVEVVAGSARRRQEEVASRALLVSLLR
jgi:hypothetical protein